MADDFIISPYAISFESIKNSLQKYVLQKSQNDDVWKDFYVSSTGETIIELAAALGTFYAFQFIAGRKENFISVAQNYTSMLGLAQNLGYSAKRGNNLKITARIIPNQTIVNLPKWTVVGTYSTYDLVLLEDVTINSGVPTDLKLVIGDSMMETYNIKSSDLTVFNFYSPNVTDDYRLVLNNEEVPTSTIIKDAMDDKYICISNVYGSLDAFYLNQGNYPYQGGDQLYLNFIQANNLDYNKLAPEQLNIDYTDQDLISVTLLEDKAEKEDLEKIRAAAPLYHQNNHLVRSRRDYKDYLFVSDLDLIDTNDKDIYPGLIEITYLKNDRSLMSSSDKQKWLTDIESLRPGGVADAVISDPIQIEKTLSIDLYKQANVSSVSSSIADEIESIISPYENKLGVSLDISQIEHDLELLDGIKIARVSLPTATWQANTAFDQFTILNTSSGKYCLNQVIHYSGSTEPTWSDLTSVGDTLIDNELIWQRVSKYPENEINTWTADTVYTINTCIRKVVGNTVTAFKVIGYTGKTGSTAPSWNLTKVIDNNITWETTSDTSSTTWTSLTDITANTVIKVVIGGTNCYYKALNAGTTGGTAPIWIKEEVNDFSLLWKLCDTQTTTAWAANTTKKISDLIVVTVDGTSFYYQVITIKGSTGSTEPSWGSSTSLTDKNFIWVSFDQDIDTINLEWNQYLKANYTFRII